ncbi:MAG TPA: Si-specific NAD(P)(+) transhydrogenase [Candidatus Eisenbacteria bacterium]|nr:Si-specific NAD(P)(+) transhydrogenase [Candidatus Eisenbacteria bacterium]
MHEFDVIVIGSGPGGQKAAIQAAKLGRTVAVIEKRRDVGGVQINTGTIPSKTLREAVIDLSGLRQRSVYGQSFRCDTDITIQDLLVRAHHVMQVEQDVVRSQLGRNGVTLIGGTASFESPDTLVVDDGAGTERYRAKCVVIAVGTTPGMPPGLTVDHTTVLTSDDILKLERLPRALTVVGAGIIGTEYATIFAALGIEVTLLDRRTELLEMMDREIADALVYQARNLGVTFRLGEEVARLERHGDGRPVVVTNSGKRFVTDLVLVSAGRVGATAELALDRAGLAADARGRIAVNRFYQTSVPHVYAVGDVIGFPALAATSMEQGRLAVCHAFGVPAEAVPELFPFGIYAIPEVAWVGKTEAELTSRGVPFETGIARYREIARGQILGDPDGMLKLLFHIENRSILGVWCLGTQATELVHIGQAVMSLNGTLDYFVANVFNYPTLAECYKVAALDGYNKLRGLGAVPENPLPAATVVAPDAA